MRYALLWMLGVCVLTPSLTFAHETGKDHDHALEDAQDKADEPWRNDNAWEEYDEEEEEEMGPWERNRADYQEKRQEYIDKRVEFRDRYKKRLGSNKYRQKAREFYGRQEGIYQGYDQ